jgi:dTMP kinase
MFITFEGLDFSGKTTQAKLLLERLRRYRTSGGVGQPAVHFIREPGGTAISERIRDILLDKNHPEMTERDEIFLFSASRTQLVSEVIVPALQRGEIVLCDRFADSTTAYQGYGRGLALDTVRTINRIATLGIEPDLTLLVDIPVAEIKQRKTRAGLAFDRMEGSGREFYERVRNGYHQIASREPHRVVVIDGTVSIGEVERAIWQAVERKLIHSHSLS